MITRKIETLSDITDLIYLYTHSSISNLLLNNSKLLDNLSILKKCFDKIHEDAEMDRWSASVACATIYCHYQWNKVSRYISTYYIERYYSHILWEESCLFFYRSWSGSREIIITHNRIIFICDKPNHNWIDNPKGITERTLYQYEFTDDETRSFIL
jgi:hypothetical protein